ncbi:hypothetical protein LTS17_008160 [Exophiala oligosperma]
MSMLSTPFNYTGRQLPVYEAFIEMGCGVDPAPDQQDKRRASLIFHVLFSPHGAKLIKGKAGGALATKVSKGEMSGQVPPKARVTKLALSPTPRSEFKLQVVRRENWHSQQHPMAIECMSAYNPAWDE